MTGCQLAKVKDYSVKYVRTDNSINMEKLVDTKNSCFLERKSTPCAWTAILSSKYIF